MFRKRNIFWVYAITVLLLTSLFPFNAFAHEHLADSVYLNGNIYTVDAAFSTATALAVKGQELIFVGDNAGAEKLIGPATKVIDLKGKTVIPGLIEGHMHYPGEGQRLLQVDAFWKPKQEILDAVKAEADRLPDGEWIIGRGWNQEVWPDNQFPTKAELDAVSPKNPVALTRACGHATWFNSLALEIGGISKDTPDPQGGEILKDSAGNPTGILTDTAAYMVRSKIPVYNETRQKEALIKAQEELFSYGLTSSMDAGSSVTDIQYMKDLYKSGALKIRLYTMVDSGVDAEAYYEIGPEVGLFDNRLTINSIKFYTDGSLGARSAWMLGEYSDRKDHVGNPRYTNDEFYQLVKKAREHGFQVATHAIGDAANRQCVDIYEKVLQELPLKDHRYRIEHFQVATIKDIQRIADLGIIPAMQAVHATSDKNMAEDRVGSDRIKGAYAWRKIIDAGSIIVNGSDAPVELVNPYHGLYAAVTRMDREGLPKGGWYPEESMTREEALRSFTIWAAFGQFEENIKGSLEAGKLADFVVIDRDYMTCPASDIKDINVLTTVVGGEVVYVRPDTNETTILYKAETIDFSKTPRLREGRVLVPAKELLEKMGANFEYHPEEGTLHVVKDDVTLHIKIDEKEASLNGKTIPLDVAACTTGDTVYVPLRFVGEAFGYHVTSYSDSNIISINF